MLVRNKKLIMNNVINKVYKKLSMLSKEKFKDILNSHRNGRIAKIVKETNREKNNK